MTSVNQCLSVLFMFFVVGMIGGVDQLHSRVNDIATTTRSDYRVFPSQQNHHQANVQTVFQGHIAGVRSHPQLWPVTEAANQPFAKSVFNADYNVFKPVIEHYPSLISFNRLMSNRPFSGPGGFRHCSGTFCDFPSGTNISVRFQQRSSNSPLVSRPSFPIRQARRTISPASKSFGLMGRIVAPKVSYNVFRSVVIPVGKLPGFRQWQRIAPSILTVNADICSGISCNTQSGARMARAAAYARHLHPVAAVAHINREVNRAIRYRSDRGDHWSSLAESAARGVGDCEDYAIAKMALLRRIGFSPEQLQFIILKDVRRQLYHAVLVAHIEGRRYVLDNLSNNVAPDRIFRSYVPIASFVGNKHYLHGFVGRSSAIASLGKGGLSSIRLGNRS